MQAATETVSLLRKAVFVAAVSYNVSAAQVVSFVLSGSHRLATGQPAARLATALQSVHLLEPTFRCIRYTLGYTDRK